MAEEESAPTFTTLVVGKAWSNTKRFFKSMRRDLVISIGPGIVGFLLYWRLRGFPVALDELVGVAAFTFGPIGFACVAVMLWYFLIAPAELAYEAAKAKQSISVVVPKEERTPPELSQPVPTPVDWGVWRMTPQYSLQQFAAILAKESPIMPLGPRAKEILNLLVTEARTGQLYCIRSTGYGVFGDQPYPISPGTKVSRESAVNWAGKHDFDLAHIT